MFTTRSMTILLALVAMVGFVYVARDASIGTTFAVGEVDITIDNESYYNGTLNPDTSWSLTDLTIEKFFNFTDVKPGDYGEDTISLHVAENDSFLCADVTLTSNNENGCTEPEGLVDGTCGNPGAGDGELASLIEFMWWADDGDNVFESDETIISEGSLGALAIGVPFTVTLADSAENIWTGQGGPVSVGSTEYIGKAWCYGEIMPAALTQDGESDDWSPADDNDNSGTPGEPADGGFLCEGQTLGNESQTDSATLDVAFNAVQSAVLPEYLCEDGEPEEPEPILTDGFGTGDCLQDIPGWDEDAGESCVNGTVARNTDVSGDNSVSPDGGRFALLSGNNGFLCRSVNATGFQSLVLSYYWRGDTDAEDNETGSVHYFTTGTCAAPGPLSTLASHELDDGNNNVVEPWALNTINLPGALNNSTFFIRFTADSNNGNESLRIDGVSITGIPI